MAGPGVELIDVLPPPPVAESPQDGADRATFRTTRSLQGSPRRQATADVDERVPAMLADFTPAAGHTLSVAATPALARLLARMRGDVAAAVNGVKPVDARLRPFLVDDSPVCPPDATLERSFDYPSGHGSGGTSVSLIIAEMIPTRATALLARGRDYGDSRVICGMHNASAVAAG